jgi:hypothetical protein
MNRAASASTLSFTSQTNAGVNVTAMTKALLPLGALAALLSACSTSFSAQTVGEVFIRYPGNHTIINAAGTPMDVPLGANESVAVVVNPGTFSINGAAVAGSVGSFVTATPANARVLGTQLGYTLHLLPDARNQINAALANLCTDDGNGGCTQNVPADAKVYTVTSTTIPAGGFGIRAARVNTARGGAGASFQAATQVTFVMLPAGSTVAPADGDAIFVMDLNSAKRLANPLPLPPSP